MSDVEKMSQWGVQVWDLVARLKGLSGDVADNGWLRGNGATGVGVSKEVDGGLWGGEGCIDQTREKDASSMFPCWGSKNRPGSQFCKEGHLANNVE